MLVMSQYLNSFSTAHLHPLHPHNRRLPRPIGLYRPIYDHLIVVRPTGVVSVNLSDGVRHLCIVQSNNGLCVPIQSPLEHVVNGSDPLALCADNNSVCYCVYSAGLYTVFVLFSTTLP